MALKKILKDFSFNTIYKLVLEPTYIRWVRFKAEKFGIGQRDWTQDNIETIRAHWKERRSHTRNYFLHDKIINFNPGSILEIGSSCGNILFLLAQSLPSAKIVGIEINPVAVEYGNANLRENNIFNVTLEHGTVEHLSKFSDKSFDVVFSSAVLMYVRPEDIKNVLNNMVRISKKGVLLLEMHEDNQKKYLGEFYPPSNWKRDYRRIFNELGVSNDRIVIKEVAEDIWRPGGGGAAYIEVRL